MKQYGKQGAFKAGPTNLGLSGEAGPGFKAVQGAKRGARIGKIAAKKGFRAAKKSAGMALGAVKANPGKAGMALAGLAAAGGLGMAGMKALGARKKKANSLQGRLSSAMKKIGK